MCRRTNRSFRIFRSGHNLLYGSNGKSQRIETLSFEHVTQLFGDHIPLSIATSSLFAR